MKRICLPYLVSMGMLEIPDLHGGLVAVKDWHGNVHENEWVLVISQTHIASTSPHYPSSNLLHRLFSIVGLKLTLG